jgi:subtilase family serine protease
MNESLKDILSHLNPDIDQETLLRYLQGKLSSDEQHSMEKKMMDNDFNMDALEGLEGIKNKNQIQSLITQLNNDLRKKTEKKKRAKEKRSISLDPWVIIAIIIILARIVISYVIIRKMQ